MVLNVSFFNKVLKTTRGKFNMVMLMKLRVAKKKASESLTIFSVDYEHRSAIWLYYELAEIRSPWMRHFKPLNLSDVPSERKAYDDEARSLNLVSARQFATPSFHYSTKLLENVILDIEEGISTKLNPYDIIHNIIVDLHENLDLLFSDIEDQGIDSVHSKRFPIDRDYLWHDKYTSTEHQRKHKDHYDLFTKLVNMLRNPRTPEEVVRYILNPHMTSAVVKDFGIFKIRFFNLVIPEAVVLEFAQEAFTNRGSDFLSTSDSRLEDKVFVKDADIWRTWAESIARTSGEKKMPSYEEPTPKVKALSLDDNDSGVPTPIVVEEDDDLDFTVKEGEGSIKGDDDEDEPVLGKVDHSDDDQPVNDNVDDDPSQQGSNNQQGSSQQQPPPTSTVIDDSGYTPDPRMAFRAKNFIDKFHALTDDDEIKKHIHVYRFNTYSENPVNLWPRDLKPYDYRVRSGNTRMDPLFVITFTEKSGKPIFNRVN